MILTIGFLFYYPFRLHSPCCQLKSWCSSPLTCIPWFRSPLLLFLLQITIPSLGLSPNSVLTELNDLFSPNYPQQTPGLCSLAVKATRRVLSVLRDSWSLFWPWQQPSVFSFSFISLASNSLFAWSQNNEILCEAVTSQRQWKLQNLFVWLQMTDLGGCPSSEMKQCASVTVDYEQNAFSSPNWREYNQLPGKAFLFSLCGAVPSSTEWGREPQVMLTLKGFCNWTHLLSSAKQDLSEPGVTSWTAKVQCRLI